MALLMYTTSGMPTNTLAILAAVGSDAKNAGKEVRCRR